ncbi:MAG: ATP-binding cassette domain-containing protein, partial [Treponema sp.]|nr:ATP-binding cassette domain-containing protein [Treponema sp.]
RAAKAEYKQQGISRPELDRAIRENKEKIREAEALRRKIRFDTKIQMIYQDPASSLDPRMTVREIIGEGLRIRGVKDERQIGMAVAKALVRVGLLSEYADRYPHEFSGGQRQRIGIARAIIMEPSLIIADEPISALDVSIKAQVINLLNELRRDLGLTVLFIAHDLSVVKYFCDRIAVMYRGKIVEMAPSAELFARPLHPYTRSLLSAVPLPDPHYERRRERTVYRPGEAHDYRREKPLMRQIAPSHYVWCNGAEAAKYKQDLETGE